MRLQNPASSSPSSSLPPTTPSNTRPTPQSTPNKTVKLMPEDKSSPQVSTKEGRNRWEKIVFYFCLFFLLLFLSLFLRVKTWREKGCNLKNNFPKETLRKMLSSTKFDKSGLMYTFMGGHHPCQTRAIQQNSLKTH